MKKILCILFATVLVASLFAGCASAKYKKGVDYDDFPDREIPIYDDAIVYSYEYDEGEWEIEYGTEDDVDDVMDFYQDEFEDEDYTITDEKEAKDEYSVEGVIDEYEFEIEAEESRGDLEKYFDTVVTVTVTDTEYEEEKDEDKKDNDKDTKKEDKDIPLDEIKIIDQTSVTVPAEGAVSVGGLDEYGIYAEFDSSAFGADSTINISLVSSSDFPEPDSERFSVGDVGYDISIEGAEYTRPDGVVDVTFKLTDEMTASLEDEGFLQIAYYYNGEWYLMEPYEVDLEQGTAKISIYHFCYFWKAKPTKGELRNQVAEELAVKKFNDENIMGQIATEGKTDIEKLITEVTGVTDTKALNAIAEYMLNEDDLSSLLLSADKGDTVAGSTKLAEMIAKKINSAALIGDNATLIAGAFQAAGYIWEGDAKGAAEAAANAILDSTAYGKVFKLAVTVTQESINSWKKNGIEEMYQAYKNGADEGWFGYQVEKGSFEQAIDQSAAIERQIKIDAVKNYCKVNGKQESELSDNKLNEIKDKAVSDLKAKFEARVKQEAQIAKDKDYYKKLLDMFDESDVDGSVTMKSDLMESFTYKERLNSYVRVADRIMEMTGRTKIEYEGLVDDTEITDYDLAHAIKKWYEEDGEKKVRDFLREKGYIPAPTAESLSGVWFGTMTTTEASFDTELLQEILDSMPEEDKEGCDEAQISSTDEQMEDMVGQSSDVEFTATGSGSTITMVSSDGSSTMTLSYNKESGTMTLVSITGSDDSAGYNFSGSFTLTEGMPPHINGTITMVSKEQVQSGISLPEGMIRMVWSVSLVKQEYYEVHDAG